MNLRNDPIRLINLSGTFVGTVERERVNAMKKMKSIEKHRYEDSHYADDDDNIVFEDFARMRMNEPDE